MSLVFTRNEFRVKGSSKRDTFEHLAGQRAPAASPFAVFCQQSRLVSRIENKVLV
jgi:hypothetical protein